MYKKTYLKKKRKKKERKCTTTIQYSGKVYSMQKDGIITLHIVSITSERAYLLNIMV